MKKDLLFQRPKAERMLWFWVRSKVADPALNPPAHEELKFRTAEAPQKNREPSVRVTNPADHAASETSGSGALEDVVAATPGTERVRIKLARNVTVGFIMVLIIHDLAIRLK